MTNAIDTITLHAATVEADRLRKIYRTALQKARKANQRLTSARDDLERADVHYRETLNLYRQEASR